MKESFSECIAPIHEKAINGNDATSRRTKSSVSLVIRKPKRGGATRGKGLEPFKFLYFSLNHKKDRGSLFQEQLDSPL